MGKVIRLSFDTADRLESELLVMIEERNKARESRDFKKADSIRKELEVKGIILEDTNDGQTIWRKKI